VIELAELKLYIGAVNDGDDADDILTDLEAWAVELVQRATGKYFGASGAITWYLPANGDGSIFLPDAVTAVGSVSYRVYPYEDWTDLTVTTEYVLLGQELIRTDGGVFPAGRNTVKVTATRGYAAGDEPAPIRTLVKDLVNWQYRAGRKLSLEDFGAPDVGKVAGWERTIAMFRSPLYG
jgi:hypothetical protein